VALNLHGVKSGEIERGMLVATPGVLHPSFMLDVSVQLLASWEKPLQNRARVRVHHGAAELLGRVVLLDREALGPGETAPAQLRLESPLAAERGDRLVLRQYSPMRTLGGAVVLDPVPAKHKRFRTEVLETLALQEAGGPVELVHDAVRRAALAGQTASELRAARLVADEALDEALAGLVASGTVVLAGETYYDAPRVAQAVDEVRRFASQFQSANPLAWGIGRAELQERLGHKGTKARFGELLAAIAAASAADGDALYLRAEAVRAGSPERALPPADRAALEKLAALLHAGGATPPIVSELQAQLGLGGRFPAFVSLLEEEGSVVRVADGLLYHREALQAIEAVLRTHLAAHPSMSMGDFKDLTGLTRKFTVPLLEYFDRRGLTARQGDNRVPGPLLRGR
jgi:selenocysteine-specific elongation factor